MSESLGVTIVDEDGRTRRRLRGPADRPPPSASAETSGVVARSAATEATWNLAILSPAGRVSGEVAGNHTKSAVSTGSARDRANPLYDWVCGPVRGERVEGIEPS